MISIHPYTPGSHTLPSMSDTHVFPLCVTLSPFAYGFVLSGYCHSGIVSGSGISTFANSEGAASGVHMGIEYTQTHNDKCIPIFSYLSYFRPPYLTNLKNHFQSKGCFLIRLSNSATMISFVVALFSQSYFLQYSLSTSSFSILTRNAVSSITISRLLYYIIILEKVNYFPLIIF